METTAVIHIYKIILWFQGFGQEFFLSRPKYAIRGTGILGRIASFERRLRGTAPTPLALPCPFRTSTRTRTNAERDKRKVATIPHVDEEFRRVWLYLNVCSAWMIYKIGIISKRYLIMFGILRWQTLEGLFLCCTFLLVCLVSCSVFIVFVSARFASCFLTFQLLPANLVFLPTRF